MLSPGFLATKFRTLSIQTKWLSNQPTNYLTPISRFLLRKPVLPQLVEISPAFYKPEDAQPPSQQHAPYLYPEPFDPSPHNHTVFL